MLYSIHPDFTPIIDNSEAQIDVNIYDGELVNFTPIQAMSSFFKDKDLNMVKFDTLRNSLSFQKQYLIHSIHEIDSSLGYLEISGSQAMDKHMEYYLRFLLNYSQAGFSKLFQKSRRMWIPTR